MRYRDGVTEKDRSVVNQAFEAMAIQPLRRSFAESIQNNHLKHFSYFEIVTPAQPHKTALSYLIPPTYLWQHAMAVLKVCDAIREGVGQPIYMRNFYRPPEYNKAVGGAKHSDHLDACAADLVFQTVKHRRRGLAIINSIEALMPWLEFSIGVGHETIHVGMLSTRGRRRWEY